MRITRIYSQFLLLIFIFMQFCLLMHNVEHELHNDHKPCVQCEIAAQLDNYLAPPIIIADINLAHQVDVTLTNPSIIYQPHPHLARGPPPIA